MKYLPWAIVAVSAVILVGLMGWLYYYENLPLACQEPISRLEIRNTTLMQLTQYGDRGMLEVVNLTDRPVVVERTGQLVAEYRVTILPAQSKVLPCGKGRIIKILPQ